MNDSASNTAATDPATTAINVFVSPNEVYPQLINKPSFLIPLLLVVLAQVTLFIWYFSIVDYLWLVDHLIVRMGDIPSDQRDAVRDAYLNLGSKGMMASTVVSVVLMTLLIYSLQAGYLSLISALSGSPYRFRQWFSLTSWTYLPSLLIVIVSMVSIILSEHGQIGLYDLNALSLRNLGIDPGGNMVLGTLLDSTNIPMFWSLGLLIAGYQAWVKSGYLLASMVILSPYVAIGGIWLAVAMS